MRPLIAFAILAPITTAALFGWQVAGYVVSLGSLACGVAWLCIGFIGWLADRMSRRQEAADDLAYGDWPAVPTFRDTDITKFAHPHPASIAEEGR